MSILILTNNKDVPDHVAQAMGVIARLQPNGSFQIIKCNGNTFGGIAAGILVGNRLLSSRVIETTLIPVPLNILRAS